MIPDKERHLYMAINKISEFPKVTPSADDKILIEKNGEGGHINLSEMPVSTLVNAKITGEVNSLKSRIDNIMASSGNDISEIVDARQGSDGTNYASLKARLDAENNQLKGDLNKFCSVELSKNLFDKSNVTTGFILSDGTISTLNAYANYRTSDFIEIEPNEKYTCSYVNRSGSLATATRVVVCFFDSDKNVISGSYLNADGVGFVSFNNQTAKYIRVSFLPFCH